MTAQAATARLARPHPRRRAAAALTALLWLALAGCGGDAGGDAAGGNDPAAATQTTDGAAPDQTSDATPEVTEDAGGAAPGAVDPPDGAEAPGAPVGERRGAGQAAPGAPIRIPARVTDQGLPLDQIAAAIEQGVREQCGGSLCVRLRVEHRDFDPYTSCQFVQTEPEQRSTVPRGTTIVIVAGAAPCAESPTPDPVESPVDPPVESPAESPGQESDGAPDQGSSP